MGTYSVIERKGLLGHRVIEAYFESRRKSSDAAGCRTSRTQHRVEAAHSQQLSHSRARTGHDVVDHDICHRSLKRTGYGDMVLQKL